LKCKWWKDRFISISKREFEVSKRQRKQIPDIPIVKKAKAEYGKLR
jgi:hypothetical protein